MQILIKILGYVFLAILIAAALIALLMYIDTILPLSKPGPMDRDLVLKAGLSAEELARCSGVMGAEYLDSKGRFHGESELFLLGAATAIDGAGAEARLAAIASTAKDEQSRKASVDAILSDEDRDAEQLFSSIGQRITTMANCVEMVVAVKSRLEAEQ